METIVNVLSVALLVFGFGFVVFWHELGHFLAAKAVGIKVDQFAVGFGHALLCWRKGIGITVGTSAEKYRTLVNAEVEKRKGLNLEFKETLSNTPSSETELAIAQSLGLGETEYRLNWIPLGGYVKMLGQDDMDPNAQVNDPRAFNNKSVSARMLVISAGVIMNVLLAALFFVALFLIGYQVSPAIVGNVVPGSPAQVAGMQVGDRITEINGRSIHDFTKVQYNTALLHEGSPTNVKVLRNGTEQTLTLTPRKPGGDPNGFLAMGIAPAPALRGPPVGVTVGLDDPATQISPDAIALRPGEIITAINSQPITPEEPGKDAAVPSSYATLDRALQASDGKPVSLSVRDPAGKVRDITISPNLVAPFDPGPTSVAGVTPRPMILVVQNNSPAKGKLHAGDVVLALEFDDTRSTVPIASIEELRTNLQAAGAGGRAITLRVQRGPEVIDLPGLVPSININGKKGLGIALAEDIQSPIVASVVPKSPAERAGLPKGAQILSVAGTPVSNLLEFRRALLTAGTSAVPITFSQSSPDASATRESAAAPGKTETVQIQLTAAELAELQSLRVTTRLPLAERIEPRRTSNPAQALLWGVTETRDLILQGYVTIQRMFQGSVSASNLTGPVGIFHAGGMIATNKSADWTLWFLAMISANLAVVNFLPLPVVDGGLFCFLIIEKLRGRPLSNRAQGVAQIAGLALILSIFLFVTYHDILRLL